MYRFKYVLIIIGTLLVSSCANFSRIEIGEVKDFTVKGFEDNALLVSVTVPVENPTMHKIIITDIDSRVFLNDQYLGKINSFEQLEIERKSKHLYTVDFSIRLANFLGTALKVMSLKEGQNVDIRLEGEVSGKSGLLKKKIPFNETHRIKI